MSQMIPIKPHVEIVSKSISINHHTVFLDETITSPSDYREVIQLLLHSNELDNIDIIINNVGGGLVAARAVIECIKNTSAKVKAVIIGECHSAASMIALSCEDIVVLDSAEMMIHQASWGVVGTASNVKAQNDFYVNQTTKMVKEIYRGFLTDKEITAVLSGTEYWFDSDEIFERIERMQKLREKDSKQKKQKERVAKTEEQKEGDH